MIHMKKENQGHIRFYCLLMLLLGLIAVRYALQINIPRFVLVGVILLIALMGDGDEIITMCMCCIPLHESIDFFYSVMACMIIFMVKFHRQIRINPTVIPVFLLLAWELLHCFGDDFSVMKYLTDCVMLIFLAVLMCTDVSEINYDFLVRALAVTTAITSLSLLVKLLYMSHFNIVDTLAGLQRLGLDSEEVKQQLSVSGGEINPNTLGIICVLATTGLMQLRTAGRGTGLDTFTAVILLVFGTLTSSRTYLACLAIMVVLLLFSQQGSYQRKIRFILGLIASILVALLLLYLTVPGLLEFYVSRFLVDDITTGRNDTFARYLKFIFESPKNLLFGVGFQNFSYLLLSKYSVSVHVPHNGLQEVALAWGLPGLAVFCVVLLLIPLRARAFCKKQTLLNYVPFLILLAKVQAGQMVRSSYTMLAFSFAYLSLSTNLEHIDHMQETNTV